MNLNKITVRKKDIVMRPCAACGTNTAHIGKEGNRCLQCVVDGAYSADNFKHLNRWVDADGKALTEPRGFDS